MFLTSLLRQFIRYYYLWHAHADMYTHTHMHVWMYSSMHKHTQIQFNPSCTHRLHFTFHIRAVMMPCHKAPHPSNVLWNNRWMVTQQVGASVGGPNMLQHGALCLSNHRVENLMDTYDCPGMASYERLCTGTSPFKIYQSPHTSCCLLNVLSSKLI